MSCNFSYRNICCAISRKSVSAGADCGESNGLNLMRDGQLQTIAITGGQQVVFIVLPIAPDGADRVNDMFGRKMMTCCDPGVTRIAAAELPAFFKQSFTSRAMDGPIDATAAQ